MKAKTSAKQIVAKARFFDFLESMKPNAMSTKADAESHVTFYRLFHKESDRQFIVFFDETVFSFGLILRESPEAKVEVAYRTPDFEDFKKACEEFDLIPDEIMKFFTAV